MKRQKNGVWKLTDDEMLDVVLALFDASEHGKRNGCPAIAKEYREMWKHINTIAEDAGLWGIDEEVQS